LGDIMYSFALLVMLAIVLNFDRSTVKHALQNTPLPPSGFLTALECTKFYFSALTPSGELKALPQIP